MRKMFGSKTIEPNVVMVSRFAFAAGTTGIIASLCLIIMYARLGLQGGSPGGGTLLGSAFHATGSASDLLGSLSTAFIIPVALFLGKHLPRRRAACYVQVAGLVAMVILSIGGPLLVLGVLAFEVETPISMVALTFLGLWLSLVNRWLRRSNVLPYRLVRFGGLLGAGFLAGAVIVGLGLLLPWMSWPQLVVFGVGILVGLPGYLGIPVWFVLLGRYLGSAIG
jgi:hypothetical protein